MILSAGEPGYNNGPANDNFTLFINQLVPAGNGSLLATVSGTIASTNSVGLQALI
jgi:hypothetical protein